MEFLKTVRSQQLTPVERPQLTKQCLPVKMALHNETEHKLTVHCRAAKSLTKEMSRDSLEAAPRTLIPS